MSLNVDPSGGKLQRGQQGKAPLEQPSSTLPACACARQQPALLPGPRARTWRALSAASTPFSKCLQQRQPASEQGERCAGHLAFKQAKHAKQAKQLPLPAELLARPSACPSPAQPVCTCAPSN